LLFAGMQFGVVGFALFRVFLAREEGEKRVAPSPGDGVT
jgi:hypothetical protein